MECFSVYDRMVVTGTLPGACYAQGMTAFVSAKGIRIFDYPRFAEPLRDAIRARAQELAESAGAQIEHIRKDHLRKEEVVQHPRVSPVEEVHLQPDRPARDPARL